MVDQASMSRGNGTNHHASPLSMVSNLADFGNDIATLAELQAKLAEYDAKECLSRAKVPLGFLGAGVVLALGSVPVLLIGLADVIATSARISPASAQLIVGAVAVVIAALGVVFGVRGVTTSLESFRRSREELVRNLSWIRTVVAYSGRNAGKRHV